MLIICCYRFVTACRSWGLFGPHSFWGMKNKHFVNSRFGLVGYDTTSCGGGAPTYWRNVTASIAKVVVAPYHIYIYIYKSLKCIGGGDAVCFIGSHNHISNHSVQFGLQNF
jgi:hypothetical protein